MKAELNYEQLAKTYAGKLLLRSEIDLHDQTLHTLLQSSTFSTLPSILQKRFSNQCQRCGNHDIKYFGQIDCLLCGHIHLYCRKCISMGRVSACQPLYLWTGDTPAWPIIAEPCTWKGELTEAQQVAANRVKQAILQKEKDLLVWAVAGAGKTEMLFPGIAEAIAKGQRVCIATPRADVVRELYPRIKSAFQMTEIQALYGGSEERDGIGQLIIATTHQLLRFKHAFDVIVLDEMDAFPYTNDPSLPFVTSRALKTNSTMIYLTATPKASDQIKISRQKLPHVFVPNRYHRQALPIPQSIPCFSLKKDIQANQVPKALLKWIKHRNNPHRQLLLFVPTIQIADQWQKFLPELFLQHQLIQDKSELTTVHASDHDRKTKVELFREKKLKILVTTTILERGVTFPSVDVVVVDAGHDVFDEAALVQIAGRAGRSALDPTGEVLFMHTGKTEAIIRSIQMIKQMNKRAGLK